MPAPDLGTNEKVMAWVMDTYSMHMRHTVTAVVTGKPLDLGGSRGRREATGRGVHFVCDKAIEKLRMKREECRVVIQGFGNVGSMAAMLLAEAGYKIIGVSDIHGGLFNEKGFDVPALIDWVHVKRKPLPEFPGGGAHMSGQELLFQPCEILIPAAIENQITSANAHRVQRAFFAKAPTGRRRLLRTKRCAKKMCSSCRTFSRMPAA